MSNTTKEAVLAAWREQLAAAARQPLMGEILEARSREIWPRFADFHEILQALPRRRRRALQRRLGQTLAAVALMLALGNESAMAATIDVDGDNCTLAAAITAANTDTASGGCVAGNGADTLSLRPNSTHTLTRIDNYRFGPTGLPVVASEILIEGNGATIERKKGSAPEFRILAVNNMGALTLEQATVTGGITVANHGSGPHHYSQGGGLYSYGGDVTLSGSTIIGNTARLGGGIYVDARGCGGTTVTTIANSTISGNSGGGVHLRSYYYCTGEATISNSTVSGNSGVGVTSISSQTTVGTLSIVNSTISANSNGGVFAVGGWEGSHNTTIASSTISGNSSEEDGAGVEAYAGYSSNTLAITNTTISGNSAKGNGGGVHISGGGGEFGGDIDVRIADSTISGNSAGGGGGGMYVDGRTPTYTRQVTVAFDRNIIAGNIAPIGREVVVDPNESVTFTADNFNLFGFDGDAGVVGSSPGQSDIVPVQGVLPNDILDSALADNGGPTLTHALIAGSPAIDAITSTQTNCGSADQRGVPRPQDGNADGVSACDIGAYERTADAVPFARFDIASAKVKQARRAGRDQFNVAGSLRLDAESDGLDVLNKEVVVTFDSFSETIPPGSFRFVRREDDRDESSRRAFIYRSSSAGISRLILSVDGAIGQFLIVARQLDLDELELPAQVGVMLRIGADEGQTIIPLNRDGFFIGRGGQEERE